MVTRPTIQASPASASCVRSYIALQFRRSPSGLLVQRLGWSFPSNEDSIRMITSGFTAYPILEISRALGGISAQHGRCRGEAYRGDLPRCSNPEAEADFPSRSESLKPPAFSWGSKGRKKGHYDSPKACRHITSRLPGWSEASAPTVAARLESEARRDTALWSAPSTTLKNGHQTKLT